MSEQVVDTRPSWDDWAFGVVAAVALRADCSRKQVGAVILDESNHIVATGYNGADSGLPGCKSSGACPRGQISYSELSAGQGGYGNCIAIHAEVNALRQAQARGVDLSKCRLYCNFRPCEGCEQALDDSGIGEWIWKEV